ncbi:hypothetical protein IC235_13375 [Hymenobacter sp. BT664]|uniref:Uncharacterized protein n=1 Tax=Hymenobacter montanus TaxID=2771359 RepID=A0A927GK72_9BACT|nr:hypothetical protein [Hymenobacter montanus]MBD2768879.1 hypothetical protein [Hymenobacter montanus]
MTTPPWLSFLFALALGLLQGPTLRAQCLPLERLDQGVAAGRVTADSLSALLPAEGWTIHRGDTPYWTYVAPGQIALDSEQGDAWVGLRRSNKQGYYDLVYKTTHRECINQLRAELRRRGKLKAEFINCVQCEGERLVGKDYTVTIFTQKSGYATKRTAYPYVLVIRRTVAGASNLAPEVSSQVIAKP